MILPPSYFFSPFSTPRIQSTLALVFSSEPWHSMETTPPHFVLWRYSRHLRMLSALTPPPTGTSTADAGLLAAHGRRQVGADILDVQVRDVRPQGLQVLQRVVAGDEGVAGVEVAAQILGIEVLEQLA